MTLALRGLSVVVKQKYLVQDVNCELNTGQLIGLLGTNGAGKTSLLRAMAGLVNYSGSLQFNQTLLSKLTRTEYAKQVAYLAQKQPVHWALSVEQVVGLGRIPHLSSWQTLTSTDQDIIYQMMQQTETIDFAKRPVTELSGGEQARVLLARAMAVQAPILLADEPVTSLDPYHQLRVMELLQQYAEQGHLVIAVLHDFNLAARFCQQILLLNQGQLVAQGTPQQVLTANNLMQVYQLSQQDLSYIQYD
ncbi:ABC transporter ATP-binding protein [Candidatus Albibeggiatoa sp. nov. NOAA]|uniref:ABC transporter ATP-binding protein n=1 Tax=Candidatus Albibeggiatoa sp. nov. NOAA TaxID=3162724 RepID=UPI0032F72AF9|nr:ABC transporter ATP-binding protein [Thiotrichaceae bacterium]